MTGRCSACSRSQQRTASKCHRYVRAGGLNGLFVCARAAVCVCVIMLASLTHSCMDKSASFAANQSSHPVTYVCAMPCRAVPCRSVTPSTTIITQQDQWDVVKRQVQELTASSQYSNQPAIYGMVAGAEAARLRGEVPGEGECCLFKCHMVMMAACVCGLVESRKQRE